MTSAPFAKPSTNGVSSMNELTAAILAQDAPRERLSEPTGSAIGIPGVQENFIEVLHLPPIHVRLSEYAPFQEHAVITDGNCVGTIIETGLPASWAENPLPRYPRVDAESRTAKNLLLFPTFKLVIGPDHCCSMIEFPVSAGFTRQRWDFYFLGDGTRDPSYEPARREIIDFFPRDQRGGSGRGGGFTTRASLGGI